MSSFHFGNMKSIPEIMNELFNATKDNQTMEKFKHIYPKTANQWKIESNPIGGFKLNKSHLYAFVANATNHDGSPATNENGKIYSTDGIIRIAANHQSQYSNQPLELQNIMSGLKNIIQNIKLDINSTVKKQHGGKKRSHTLKKTKTKRNKKTKKITKKYKGKKRRKRNV